jgi:small subunit ribosomal protein S17
MRAAQIQTRTGTVVRLSGANTVRVETRVSKVHPIYKKRFTQVRHFLVHDPAGTAAVGDSVTIQACRPVSKLKCWQIAA